MKNQIDGALTVGYRSQDLADAKSAGRELLSGTNETLQKENSSGNGSSEETLLKSGMKGQDAEKAEVMARTQ